MVVDTGSIVAMEVLLYRTMIVPAVSQRHENSPCTLVETPTIQGRPTTAPVTVTAISEKELAPVLGKSKEAGTLRSQTPICPVASVHVCT